MLVSGSLYFAIKLNVKKFNCMFNYNNLLWAIDQTTFSLHIPWRVRIDQESVQVFKMFCLSPLPSVLTLCIFPKILIKLVFRSLGTRVKNNKFCDGDCATHVLELTVVHDVEHMPTRSSSPSLALTRGQKREKRTWERGWNIWLIWD